MSNVDHPDWLGTVTAFGDTNQQFFGHVLTGLPEVFDLGYVGLYDSLYLMVRSNSATGGADVTVNWYLDANKTILISTNDHVIRNNRQLGEVMPVGGNYADVTVTPNAMSLGATLRMTAAPYRSGQSGMLGGTVKQIVDSKLNVAAGATSLTELFAIGSGEYEVSWWTDAASWHIALYHVDSFGTRSAYTAYLDSATDLARGSMRRLIQPRPVTLELTNRDGVVRTFETEIMRRAA